MGLGYVLRGSPKNGRHTIIIPWEPTEPIDKWCYRCRKFHLKTDFYRNSYKRDGLHDICKKCDNQHRKEKYEAKKVGHHSHKVAGHSGAGA